MIVSKSQNYNDDKEKNQWMTDMCGRKTKETDGFRTMTKKFRVLVLVWEFSAELKHCEILGSI